MFVIFQQLNKIILVTIFLLVASGSSVAEYGEFPCNGLKSSNAYYLLGIADIEEVSRYFQTLSESHFKEIESFSAIVGQRDRLVTFYDTKDLGLLNQGIELLHVVDKKLPAYREDRESIYYRDDNDSITDIKRFEVKRYNKKVAPLDKHPLFGRVKRNQRENLADSISQRINAAPETISPYLKVEHQEVVYLVSHYGSPYAEITLDKFHIINFGVPNTSTLIRYEIYPNSEFELTKRELDDLNAVFCSAQKEFTRRFPEIKPMSWFGYADYQRLATEILPSRVFFQRYPILFQLGQIAVLSFCGFLMIYLILGRYHKKVIYKVTKNNSRN